MSKERFTKLCAGLALLIVLAIAGRWWYAHSSSYVEKLFEQAYAEFEAGRHESALRFASAALEIDPHRDDVGVLAAKAAVQLGDTDAAIAYASQVSDATPSLYAAAQLLLGQQHQSGTLELSKAADAFQEVLQLDAAQVEANRGLMEVYGITGQQSLAVAPLLRLIRQSQAGDALMLVARDNGVINQLDLLEKGVEEHPNDPFLRLGLAWHAADGGNYDQAVDHVRQAIIADERCEFAHAVLGGLLASAERYDELRQWSYGLPAQEVFAEEWIARGQLAERLDQKRAAIGCYARALRIRPELMQPNARIALLLAQEGEAELAQKFQTYLMGLQRLNELQNRVFFAGGTSGMEDLLALIEAYATVGRLWEAYGWTQVAVQVEPQRADLRETLNQYAMVLREAPLQLVDPRRTPVSQVDISAYPGISYRDSLTGPESVTDSPTSAAFVLSSRMGLGPEFEYYSGTEKPPLRMFEFTGGGLGIVDYDLDGWPDCFCTQGTDWPVERTNHEFVDGAYRNLNGAVARLPEHAWLEREVGYGQGITSGDFDSDGFADIYIANAAGTNRLYRNNGDGTFTDVTEGAGISGTDWTTSVAFADLNADGHPDLYDVNYLRGDDVYSRVCQDDEGNPALCRPFDFDGAVDSIWLNDGSGGFRKATDQVLSQRPDGKGLGILVMAGNGNGRPRILVANDTTSNFLFSSKGDAVYEDRGTVSGVAFNDQGRFEGSMGIAAADVDQNGWLDLFVTNFLYESNTLYMGEDADLFVDRTRGFDLESPSLEMLGFGTQFLDLDRDGALELFVANGHIDDRRNEGRPYEMPAQLFTLSGSQFVLAKPSGLGEYFEQKWLGRSAVTVDWNRDGRQDVMVGHLYEPVTTLINETPAKGDYLSFRVVGIDSSRDGIGSRLILKGASQTRYAELTSGDGYQSFNEKVIHFGLGNDFQVERVTVVWPSGGREEFLLGDVNREYLLIEGRGTPVAPKTP